MASLWLPLARYAEDQAHQVGDDTKYFYPNAWRYRDYVIKSFNEDKPYDRFVKEQLAGDEMPGYNPDAVTATGPTASPTACTLPALPRRDSSACPRWTPTASSPAASPSTPEW